MNNIIVKNILLKNISSNNFDICLENNSITVLYDKNGIFDNVLDIFSFKLKNIYSDYFYFNQNITTFTEKDMDEMRCTDLFVIDGNGSFFSDITMKENIDLALKLNNLNIKSDLITEYSKELGINNLLEKTTIELSKYETLVFRLLLSNLINPFLMIVYNLNSYLSEEEYVKFIELIIKNNKKHKCTIAISTSNASLLKYSENIYLIEKDDVVKK